MSNKWTHNICRECWNKTRTDPPFTAVDPESASCCFCGAVNSDGIFIREDPKTLMCKGEHDEKPTLS